MTLRFKDLFCGAGGSISGLVEAGFELVLGANHSARAIETVSANYPDADFLCADINHYDMRKLPKTEVLWASVICTEMSPAGGTRKLRGQGVLALEEQGHVPSDAYERTRACALDVIRATEVHRYLAVVVENVVEFARDWELYDWWVEGMCSLGYEVQVVNVSAAHVYAPGNAPAPQWRDRIYIVFTKKGIRKPLLEPRPPSWCEHCETTVEGVQSWKRLDRRRVGKYGQQYLYRCPRCSHVVEPFVLPALAALDLSDLGERIGDRSRPLAPRTMARIQWGLENLAWPVLAQVAGNTFERPGYHRAWGAPDSPLTARQGTGTDAVCGPVVVNHGHTDDRVYAATDGPLATRTTKIGEGIAVAPFLVDNYSGGVARRVHPADGAPVSTVVAQGRGHHQLVVPFVTMLRANNEATPVTDPLATVCTGRHHYLTTPPGSFYVQHFGADPRHCSKPLDYPLTPITTKDHHALVIPYRKGRTPQRAADGPLGTQSTHTSEGVLRPEIAIEDCHYRTLKPREHLRAQRFLDSYRVAGNLGEQTMQAGNAVPVNVAHWIGAQLLEVLA